MSPRPDLSVIIPVLHEADAASGCLDRLRTMPQPGRQRNGGGDACSGGVEVVLADGGPGLDTLAALADRIAASRESNLPIVPVSAPRGRARQMNAGAGAASGRALLFLHADTGLPDNAFALVLAALARPDIEAGAFGLEIDTPNPVLRGFGRVSDLRNRLLRVPYGDQALFVGADRFRALGGFPDLPIMEDVAFMRGFRRRGERIVILPDRVRTSDRRWRKEGFLYATARNVVLRSLFGLSIPAESLARWYAPHRVETLPTPADTSDARILFFMRFPEPGRVKTRLAATVGPDRAAACYAGFVRDMLASLVRTGHPVTVCAAPGESSGAAAVRSWLERAGGPCAGLDVVEQQGADLGARMAHALEQAFARGARRAVLVGSDLPDLPPGFAAAGLTMLERRDAVIGPSLDNGYYAIGFRADTFAPEVFLDMPWSTARVLPLTRERLAERGLSTGILPLWADVDTEADMKSMLTRAGAGHAVRHTLDAWAE